MVIFLKALLKIFFHVFTILCFRMKTYYLLFTTLCNLLPSALTVDPNQDQDAEVEGKAFMEKLNDEMAKAANQLALAEWAYASNLTEHNRNLKVREQFLLNVFMTVYLFNFLLSSCFLFIFSSSS